MRKEKAFKNAKKILPKYPTGGKTPTDKEVSDWMYSQKQPGNLGQDWITELGNDVLTLGVTDLAKLGLGAGEDLAKTGMKYLSKNTVKNVGTTELGIPTKVLRSADMGINHTFGKNRFLEEWGDYIKSGKEVPSGIGSGGEKFTPLYCKGGRIRKMGFGGGDIMAMLPGVAQFGIGLGTEIASGGVNPVGYGMMVSGVGSAIGGENKYKAQQKQLQLQKDTQQQMLANNNTVMPEVRPKDPYGVQYKFGGHMRLLKGSEKEPRFFSGYATPNYGMDTGGYTNPSYLAEKGEVVIGKDAATYADNASIGKDGKLSGDTHEMESGGIPMSGGKYILSPKTDKKLTAQGASLLRRADKLKEKLKETSDPITSNSIKKTLGNIQDELNEVVSQHESKLQDNQDKEVMKKGGWVIGGEYDVTAEELDSLKQQGYQFDVQES